MEMASSVIDLSSMAGNSEVDMPSSDIQNLSASDTPTPELDSQGKEFLELFNSNGVAKVSPEEKLAQMTHTASVNDEKTLDGMMTPATSPEVILQQQQKLLEFQMKSSLTAKAVNYIASGIKQLETMQ